MRELFDLSDKYGFKAPLVNITEDFDFQAFTRICNSLDISPTTIAVASDIFIELQAITELTASLDYLSKKTNRTVSNLRHHLNALEKSALAQSEFITTDKIKKRRGKLYTLSIPKGESLSRTTQALATREVEDFRLVPSNSVETIDLQHYEDKARFIELQIVKYLAKAIRTNRKDKTSKITIQVRENPKQNPIKITARAEEGRLMYLPDMSYYAGAITWLTDHIQERIHEADRIGETFTLPLEPIVALAKDININEASGGGYVTNAINALHRISATTFDLNDFFGYTSSNITDIELYYKLFRLEAVVNFEDDFGNSKKAVVLQFPKSTISNIVNAIKSKSEASSLLLIDSEIFATNNEIQILFGLWAREHYYSGKQADRMYTWNELRESVAPSSTLAEFKRKFSNMIIANADPEYKAKIHESVADRITEEVWTSPAKNDQEQKNKVGVIFLSGNKKGERIVEYGRATVEGYLINIGYSPEHGSSVITFRRDMSGLHLLNRLSKARINA